MRVSINKLTGKMIESQSGGETQEHLDTLKQNAINQGHLEKDIEVKFVDDSEYKVLLDATKLEPTEEELYEEKIKTKEAEILRKQAIAELVSEGKIEIEGVLQ